MRERRAEFENNIPLVYDILRQGSIKAREAAAKTLDDVRSAMRINYFSDEELIKAQTEKYRK